MWIEWAKPQAEWAQGPTGRPNSLADWLVFEAVQPTALWTCVYMRRGRPRQWGKSVEAAPPGQLATWLVRSATTWRQTDLSKSVEVPLTPINTSFTVKVDTHTHHYIETPLEKLPFLL
jgi:hypothetical protein